ncbi:MAG: HU family DNA-binding protein [Prevotella sp.]|nr:HU family DNA-binding protein [Prevotella sp.]
MGKISIQDLSSVLVDKRGLSKKEASNFISEMFDIVQQELEKEKLVKIKGLGTFKIIDVDDRESVNVNTGERVLIEGHGKITFTPDSLMKELVNKPFSQFETVVLNDGVEFEEEELREEVSESQETDGDPSTMALVDFGLGNVKADLSSFPVIEDHIKKDDEIVEEPVVEEPVVEEPVVEEPVAEEPVVDEPVADEIVKEEPATEESPEEEPTVEEPAAEEPTTEEPVVEEPVSEEPNPDEIEEEDVVYDDEEENSGSKSWLWALIGCVVGLACGYLLGNYFPFGASPQTPEAPQQEQTATAKPAAEQKENIVSIDSLEAVKDSTEKAATAQEQAKPETPKAEPAKEAPKTEPAKPAADATETLSAKYAEKDARVRLGAYHIVGTDKVVKAKEGQTLKQISRTYLGPDMECYMEVYNDMKANDVLKAGQEVKIPKLVWKKAVRAKSKSAK